MNEVHYSVGERKLIDDYEKQEVKNSSDWSMEKYVALRKSIKDHYLKEGAAIVEQNSLLAESSKTAFR